MVLLCDLCLFSNITDSISRVDSGGKNKMGDYIEYTLIQLASLVPSGALRRL